MTAPRSCRKCGATLLPDLRWCPQCYEPVRELAPREPQVPTPADLVPIDPASVRPDHAPIRTQPPVYSRTRGGPTTFGLVGRIAITALVVLMLPWGSFTPLTIINMLWSVPIAVLILRSTWRREVVPAEWSVVLPSTKAISVLRLVTGTAGAALAVVAIASGGLLGLLPAVPFLLVALITPAWEEIVRAVADLQVRPLAMLMLLNALNLADILASDAAIRTGNAAELNPVVAATGTPLKIVLVGSFSLLLFWKRPRALIWPVVAYVALLAYHLTGWLIMA